MEQVVRSIVVKEVCRFFVRDCSRLKDSIGQDVVHDPHPLCTCLHKDVVTCSLGQVGCHWVFEVVDVGKVMSERVVLVVDRVEPEFCVNEHQLNSIGTDDDCLRLEPHQVTAQMVDDFISIETGHDCMGRRWTEIVQIPNVNASIATLYLRPKQEEGQDVLTGYDSNREGVLGQRGL